MLYGLFCLQINLCIAYQYDVLWHTGSNYEQLLFSSDIWTGTCAMGICAVFYMWHWFCIVVFKRCMVAYWGANDIVTRQRERGYVHMLSIFEMVKTVKRYWSCTALSLYFMIWHSHNSRERGGERERERKERERLCPYAVHMWKGENGEMVLCLYSTISVFCNMA